jgi:RecB family exonuclease
VNRIAVRDDGEHLDTGGWVRLLEYATGSSARVLGKPSPEFFTAPLDALGRGASTALVVGDDLAWPPTSAVAGRSGRPRCWSAAARGIAPSRAPGLSPTRSSTASPTCQDCSNGERANRQP